MTNKNPCTEYAISRKLGCHLSKWFFALMNFVFPFCFRTHFRNGTTSKIKLNVVDADRCTIWPKKKHFGKYCSRKLTIFSIKYAHDIEFPTLDATMSKCRLIERNCMKMSRYKQKSNRMKSNKIISQLFRAWISDTIFGAVTFSSMTVCLMCIVRWTFTKFTFPVDILFWWVRQTRRKWNRNQISEIVRDIAIYQSCLANRLISRRLYLFCTP